MAPTRNAARASRRASSPRRPSPAPAAVRPATATQRAAHSTTGQQLAVLVVLVVLALQSITLLAALEYALPQWLTSSPPSVAAVGVLSLVGFGAVALVAFRACGCRLSYTAAFFAVTGWSAFVDLILALALVGLTTLGKFYVATGEEYFRSCWGVLALVWDGTVHLVLQLYLAHATLLDQPRRLAGLAWSGSIINSLPVLLLGGATGVYSADIKPSTALNAPYVLVPILYLRHILLREPLPPPPAKPGRARRPPARSAAAAAEAVAWACLHAAAAVLHCWRAVVAMGSQSDAAAWWLASVDPLLGAPEQPSHGFVRAQALVYLFYYVPFHAWAALELVAASAPSSPLAAWSVVVAGGYAQAQFTCVGSAAFEWVGFHSLAARPPGMTPSTSAQVVAISLGVLPAAFAARCQPLS